MLLSINHGLIMTLGVSLISDFYHVGTCVCNVDAGGGGGTVKNEGASVRSVDVGGCM